MTDRLTWRDSLKDIVLGVGKVAALPLLRLRVPAAPRGNGHPVLILPGFMTSDFFMRPMRRYLRRMGYRSFHWELGFNRGYNKTRDIEALIERRMFEVIAQCQANSITLIGWSLGGIYAKALAHKHPDLVREIITLGSPIVGNVTDLPLFPIYEWVTNNQYGGLELNDRLRALEAPLPGVAMLSIYSSNDGLVPIGNALQAEGPMVQNVHVDATHLGMGYDPFVYYLIAQRLAQSQGGSWQPLEVELLNHRFSTQ